MEHNEVKLAIVLVVSEALHKWMHDYKQHKKGKTRPDTENIWNFWPNELDLASRRARVFEIDERL